MEESLRQQKQAELDELRGQVANLEAELSRGTDQPWRPSGYYTTYYATAGFMLGMFGAATSLLFNVVGSLIVGQHPLELIRVYLTFPLGEQALSPEVNTGITLAIGCCLYIATGMLLGVPFHMILARFGGDNVFRRFAVATVAALAIWVINFYVILSWFQPLLFGGNWIVDMVPWYVGAMTHLVFGWTMAMVYPWGVYEPYRLQTEEA